MQLLCLGLSVVASSDSPSGGALSGSGALRLLCSELGLLWCGQVVMISGSPAAVYLGPPRSSSMGLTGESKAPPPGSGKKLLMVENKFRSPAGLVGVAYMAVTAAAVLEPSGVLHSVPCSALKQSSTVDSGSLGKFIQDHGQRRSGSHGQLGLLTSSSGPSKAPSPQRGVTTAIIIPFRNCHEHLTHWLDYLHLILKRQQLVYGVCTINQDGDGVYSKAKLMNAGHVEALKEDDYDCFVFSDVDMVPLDDRNLYRCFDRPRHFAVAIDKFNYELPYKDIFGGVTALSKEQFLTVSGFSNTYWGWGGEDDDMYNRIMLRIKSISQPDAVIGWYKMIKHGRDRHNERDLDNVKKLQETKKILDQDGLSSLSYTVVEILIELVSCVPET
ncbi:4-galactosyltransferase 2-like [Nothobranchius furzeri]|uniref:Beta-1,4-galactosyltransferase n=1 Tax=Nothobranchius furzeri TaxID=105023 RepID=A0A9D2Y3E9_NOTFU|nr:4-galactosyltransferase 2-like [Nothobranchius furzeri]